MILSAALGQVSFLPDDRQTQVGVALQRAVARVGGDRAALREAVQQAMFAAAGAVDSPGGQSIVALLAHLPKVVD